MARIDLTNKVIHAKLVYYGPGLCGKTTNLEYVAKNLGGVNGNELMSLATEGDRTIFFDFLPLDLGTLRGLTVQFKLYTVPGQVRYHETRKMVLKNVDGIVFVADSQELMMDANLQSLDDLYSNLQALGIDSEKVSLLLQYNKRDLPTAVPVSELDKLLNAKHYPTFTASARTGEGVVETLKFACGQVLKTLAVGLPENRNEARQTAAASAAKGLAAQVAAPPGPSPVSRANGPSPPQPEPKPSSKKHADTPKEHAVAPKEHADTPKEHAVAPKEHAVAPKEHADTPKEHAVAPKEQLGNPPDDNRQKIAPATPERTVDVAPIHELIASLPTKGDLDALGRRLDELAASMKASAAPTNHDLSAVREAVSQLRAAHKADFDALEARLARLPKDVETLLSQSTAAIRELRGELAALREASSRAPAAAPSDATAPFQVTLTESNRVLSDLKDHLGELKARSDSAALSHRLDELAATIASEASSTRELCSKLIPLVTAKDDIASLRGAMAQLVDTHKVDFDALDARIGRLPKDVEALLAENNANVRELLGELREVRNARATPPPHATLAPDVLERLATKEDVAALERRLARIPDKAEIEASNRPMAEVLAAVKTIQAATGDLVATHDQKRNAAGLEALERRFTEFADRVMHTTWRRGRTPSEAPTRVPPPMVETEADEARSPVEEQSVRPTGAPAQAGHSAPPPTPAPPTPAPPTPAPPTPAPATPDREASVMEAPPEAQAPEAQAPEAQAPRAQEPEIQAQEAHPPTTPSETKPGATTIPPAVDEHVAEAAPPAAPPSAPPAPPPPSAAPPPPSAAPPPPSAAPPPPSAAPPPSAPPAPPPPSAPPAAPVQAEAAPSPPPTDERHVNAARVARVMVADLYLYHKEAVEAGVRQDDFFERNKEALADMRATYESRVPHDVRDQSDYLEKAIREFVAKKRAQLGLT